jgi:hypothetical protein
LGNAGAIVLEGWGEEIKNKEKPFKSFDKLRTNDKWLIPVVLSVVEGHVNGINLFRVP